MLGALRDRRQHGSEGQKISPVWQFRVEYSLVFQGPSMVALDLGCQGRTCPWHSGLGPRNLVQVSKKRNLELVEILWDNGDFQFRGGQGKSTD